MTSLESRNTFTESMVRRSGSVRDAQRNMQFDPIGKPTPELVAPESTLVLVEHFSLGNLIVCVLCVFGFLDHEFAFHILDFVPCLFF